VYLRVCEQPFCPFFNVNFKFRPRYHGVVERPVIHILVIYTIDEEDIPREVN
jgi:hypothetical protein